MKTLLVIAGVAVALVVATIVYAQTTTYKYTCYKCGLVQEFTSPGIHNCPNDGSPMNPVLK